MRLPIKALREVAKKYGYSHVVVFAYDTKKNMEHVATYGTKITDAAQAAQFGNMIKDALHWPDRLHAEPNRLKKIQERAKKLKEAGNLMSNLLFNWKQQDRFTKEERELLESLQVQWDAISDGK